jgi:hypothetical protein
MLCCAVLLLVATATAQTRSATLLLRSGERVSGEFEDIQNQQVYVRTGQHDERRIPQSQVAIIDFVGGTRGLPETELSQARTGGDFLLLRDGSSLRGRLIDVEREGEGGERTIANARVLVVFQTDGGRQDVAIDRVARLYLGPLPDLSNVEGALAPSSSQTTTSSPATGFSQGTGNLASNVQWSPTGIFVRAGQLVSFQASGEIRVGPDEPASPAGARSQRHDGGAPIPSALVGALIGRVGGSAPFGIGDQTGPLRMPATGELFLGINESAGGLGDNQGTFSVQITPQAMSRRR